MMLARLLASMKDDNGRVLIEHFYDGIEPLSESEKRAVAEVPDMGPELMRELWLGSTEGAPRTLAESITLPSLNVRGMARLVERWMNSENSSQYRSPEAQIHPAAGYLPVRFRHRPLFGTRNGNWGLEGARQDRRDIRPGWSAANAPGSAGKPTFSWDTKVPSDKLGWRLAGGGTSSRTQGPLRSAALASPTKTR